MHRFALLVAMISASGASLIPRAATAEPDAIEVPQVPAMPVAPAISERVGPLPHYKRFLMSFDVLGVVSDRYGAILEAALTPRDSVTAYPWYATGESTGATHLFPDSLAAGIRNLTCRRGRSATTSSTVDTLVDPS